MQKIKIFTSKYLIESMRADALEDLQDDFREYKTTGKPPPHFGRDAPYNFTHNRQYLELQHLHILKDRKPFKNLRSLQFQRTSGHVLVYCSGYFERNSYLLLAVIKHWDPRKPNDIKGTDKDEIIMNDLERIAEGFRNKF